MKQSFYSSLVLLITNSIFCQSSIEILYQDADSICDNKQNDFCKSISFFKRKNYDSCYIYSGKELLKNISSKRKDILNYLQGASALKKKMFKKALSNFEKMQSNSKYNDLKFLKLGYIYINLESYDKALTMFFNIENSNLIKNSIDLKKTLYHNIGVCYLLKKDYRKGNIFFNKKLSLVNLKDTLSLIRTKSEIANIYYNQFLDEEAISLFSEAYFLSQNYSNIDLKKITAQNMAVVEKNRKRYKESIAYYEEFNKWKDSIWNRDRVWELTEIDKNIAISEKQKEVVIKDEALKRQKLITWFVISIGLLIVCLGISIFFLNRRKLIFQKEVERLNAKHKERERISRELHDGVLSRLFGTRFGLGLLEMKSDERTLKQYQSFLNELQKVEKEIRDVSHELNKLSIDDKDYMFLIEDLMEKNKAISNISYKLSDNVSDWNTIPLEIKDNVYKILQECLYNIIKYSKARNVLIKFTVDNGYLSFFVKDDGVGFDMHKKTEGIGLKNIRHRSQSMGGKLTVNSIVEKGTIIEVLIPL